CLSQAQGQNRREFLICEAANSVGSKKSSNTPIMHSRGCKGAVGAQATRGFWAKTNPPRLSRKKVRRECRRKAKDYRLEYCGARRALCRPAFLRSTARASRVSRPAFFKAVRSAGL